MHSVLAVAVLVAAAWVKASMAASIAARNLDEIYRESEELSRHAILGSNGGSRKRRAEAADVATQIRTATLNTGLDIPGVIQGDIKTDWISEEVSGRHRRDVINSNYFGLYSTWPNCIVPYTISSTYQIASVSVILNAMNDLQQRSCVKFVPASLETAAFVGHNNSINIYSGSGCWSYIGNLQFGAQDISLQETGCLYTGVVEHELLHALGFIHAQARPDRDHHVKVLVEHVVPGYVGNFYKAAFPSVVMPTPYDLYSVMHYGLSDFATTGATIVPRVLEYSNLAGSRISASYYDEKALNYLYQCGGSCDGSICQNDGYARMVNGSCVCICPKGLGGQFCETVDSANYPCGGVIKLAAGSSATVSSPNFPQNYNTGRSCAWLIKTSGANSIVKISFTNMSLSADSSKCRHFLDIRKNLLGQPAPSIFCGTGLPSDVYSRQEYQSQTVLVLFDASDTTYSPSSGFSFVASSYTDGCLSNPCRGAPCVSTPSSSSYTCQFPTTDSFCGFESGNSLGCDMLRYSDVYDNYGGSVAQITWDVSQTTLGATTGSTSPEGSYFLLSSPLYNDYVDGSRNFGTFRIIPFQFATPTSSRCLMFKYYSYGSDVGSLSVYRAVNGVIGEPIFQQINGTAYDNWTQATITIAGTGLMSDLIEIVFMAEHYSLTFDTDPIAIDDIRYIGGSCNSGPCSAGPCANSQCVVKGTSYVCVPYENSGCASCSFESWENCSPLQTYAIGKYQFELYSWVGPGHGWPNPTGPRGPATGLTYLYGRMYNKIPGSTMSLKIMAFTGVYRCLTFKYSMYGANQGTLTVIKTVTLSTGVATNTTLWQKKGNQGDFWFSAAVDLNYSLVPATAKVELFIVAVRGGTSTSTYASDVGLDDISYSNAPCSSPQPVTVY